MGKLLDSLLGKKVQPKTSLPLQQPSRLTTRFESLGLKPSVAPRPEAQSLAPVPRKQEFQPKQTSSELVDSLIGPKFEGRQRVTIPDIEQQRLQRDVATSGYVPTIPETTIHRQGREFVAPKSEAVRSETIARLGATDIGRSILGVTPEQAEAARLQTPIISQRPATTRTVADVGFLGDVGGQTVDIPEKIIRTGDISKRVGQIENIAGMMTQYAGVSSALRPALQKIGLTGLKGFGAKQLTDLAIDNIVQLPREILDAIKQDKTIPQFVADTRKRNVVDAVFNAVLGIGDLRQAMREMKAVGDPIVDEAVSQSFKSIQEELGLPKDMTAEQFLKEQEQVAKDVEIEEFFKQFETPEAIAKESTLQPPIVELPTPARAIAPEISPQEGLTGVVPPRPFTSVAEDIGIPRVEPIGARTEIQIPTGRPPESTLDKVLTDVPTKSKQSIGDTYDRIIQEVISKNVPFERIGGLSKVQASNLNRLQGAIEYNVVGKQTDMSGNEIGKSVVEIFSDVPKESKQQLFDYAFHKHNIDRAKEGKSIFGENVDSAYSAQKVAQYEQTNPEFIQKQQEIKQYFNNLLNEWGVKGNLTSKESADMLTELYSQYVPTYRALDIPKTMTNAGQNIGQIIKNAKGSEKQILPLDQQMIAMTERFVKNAKKNELMNTVARAFEAGDSMASRYVKEIKGLDQAPVDGLLDVGRNLDEVPTIKGNEYLVNFYTDGKPRQMVVNKTLFKALENSSSDQAINTIANVVKKYATQPFKNLITGYNPVFAASNIMRDIPTALVYSKNPVKMVASAPDAVKEMLTNGENFKLFKAMGGTREGLIGSGKTFKVPTLGQNKSVMKTVNKANPIKAIGDVNNFTETLPRFSEFLSVLKETGDPALAVYKSAELTTDFSRHGNLTKMLDSFVPYLNPSVQGIDKFFRGFKESPLKTALAGGSVITVPSIILDQVNKDNEAYNNLPARERNLYFQVPIPDSDKFLRIPKSRELGVAFSSIAEWALRTSRGEKVTGEEIKQAIEENFTPADITSPIWTPALKAWSQIKDPDAYETNFWGGLIVPQSQRRYSPGEQYDLNSSGVAKAIGQQFNISPYVVDYLIKSYTGIIGQVVQPIGADRKTTPLAPLERKFITDPTFKSDVSNKFYTLLDDKKKEAQDFNKQNNIPSKVVTPLEREASFLNRVSSQISELRKQLKEAQTKKNQDDKIKSLQEQMNKLANDAIKKFE